MLCSVVLCFGIGYLLCFVTNHSLVVIMVSVRSVIVALSLVTLGSAVSLEKRVPAELEPRNCPVTTSTILTTHTVTVPIGRLTTTTHTALTTSTVTKGVYVSTTTVPKIVTRTNTQYKVIVTTETRTSYDHEDVTTSTLTTTYHTWSTLFLSRTTTITSTKLSLSGELLSLVAHRLNPRC